MQLNVTKQLKSIPRIFVSAADNGVTNSLARWMESLMFDAGAGARRSRDLSADAKCGSSAFFTLYKVKLTL